MNIIQIQFRVSMTYNGTTTDGDDILVPKFRSSEDVLPITAEDPEKYIVKSEYGDPRGGNVYKEKARKLIDSGYACLNIPASISCDGYDASGMIFVLESEVQNGNDILKSAILNIIERKSGYLEELKQTLLTS